MHPNLIKTENLLTFIFAGKAIFTARGKSSRFTYKVRMPIRNGTRVENMRYVYVMTGPDNYGSYSYIGCLIKRAGTWEFRFKETKFNLNESSVSVVAFKWIMNRILHGLHIPDNVEIWHEGHCGKCGRRLTVPESIERGFGPECIAMLGL